MTEKVLWLLNELKVLVDKKIISPEVASKIRQYYAPDEKKVEKPKSAPGVYDLAEFGPKLVTNQVEKEKPVVKKTAPKAKKPINIAVLLSVIAGVLIGTGTISLIAYNWSAIGQSAKATAAFLFLTIIPAITFYIKYKKPQKFTPIISEFLSMLWALLFAGSLVLLSQVYRTPSNMETFFLVWLVSSFAIAWLFSSKATYLLAFAITGFYIANTEITGLWIPFYSVLAGKVYQKGKELNKKEVMAGGLIGLIVVVVIASVPDLWTSREWYDVKSPQNIVAAVLNLIVVGVFLTKPVLKFLKDKKENKAGLIDLYTVVYPWIFFVFVIICTVYNPFENYASYVLFGLLLASFAVLANFRKQSLWILPPYILLLCLGFSPIMLIPLFFVLYIAVSDSLNWEKTLAYKKYFDYGVLALFIQLCSVQAVFIERFTSSKPGLNIRNCLECFSIVSAFAFALFYSVRNKTFTKIKMFLLSYGVLLNICFFVAVVNFDFISFIPMGLFLTLIPVTIYFTKYYKTLFCLIPLFIPVLANIAYAPAVGFAAVIITVSAIELLSGKSERIKYEMDIGSWILFIVMVCVSTVKDLWKLPSDAARNMELFRDFFLVFFAFVSSLLGFIADKKFNLKRICILVFSQVIAAFMVANHFAPGFGLIIPYILFCMAAVFASVYAVMEKNPFVPFVVLIPTLFIQTEFAVLVFAALFVFSSVINIFRETKKPFEKMGVKILIRCVSLLVLCFINSSNDFERSLDCITILSVSSSFVLGTFVLCGFNIKKFKGFDSTVFSVIVFALFVVGLFQRRYDTLNESFYFPNHLKDFSIILVDIFGVAGFLKVYFQKEKEYLPYVIALPLAMFTLIGYLDFAGICLIFAIGFSCFYLISTKKTKRNFHVITALVILGLTFCTDLTLFNFYWYNDFTRIVGAFSMILYSSYALIPAVKKFVGREKFNHVIPFFVLVFMVMFLISYFSSYEYPENFVPVTFLILAFAVVVYNMYGALKNNSLARANLSAVYMLMAIVSRFFDDSITFVTKGVIFIVCGIAILVFNLVFLNKQKKL